MVSLGPPLQEDENIISYCLTEAETKARMLERGERGRKRGERRGR